MSAFFGLVMSAFSADISSTSVSSLSNVTTSTITATTNNTGGGTLTYVWSVTGVNCTITSPSSASTTVTGSNTVGTSTLSCAITNSATGVTKSTPVCTITWTATVPGAPTIGASSSADKSFTINWTAPTSDGGSNLTGYYVQNSTNGGSSWSTAVLVTGATTYTWSGNTVVYNGNTYIGRVAAVNSIGTGTYSGSSTGRVPTFAAPSCSVTGQAGYPSTSDPLRRPLTVTINPTACVNYSYTQVYLYSFPYQDNPGNSYSSYVQAFSGGPGFLFTTNSSAAGQTGNVYSIYQSNLVQGTQYWLTGANITYSVYVITYNNDGYGVQSGTATFTTAALQTGYTYNPDPVTTANAISLYVSGQFNVNSGTYSVAQGSITSNDWNVVKLNVSARTAVLSSTYGITSASRYFLVDYTGSTTSTYTQVFNGNGTPFNAANSGNQTRNTDVDITDTGFSGSGTGVIRVRGSGTFTTGTTIQVNITAYGQTRTSFLY